MITAERKEQLRDRVRQFAQTQAIHGDTNESKWFSACFAKDRSLSREDREFILQEFRRIQATVINGDEVQPVQVKVRNRNPSSQETFQYVPSWDDPGSVHPVSYEELVFHIVQERRPMDFPFPLSRLRGQATVKATVPWSYVLNVWALLPAGRDSYVVTDQDLQYLAERYDFFTEYHNEVMMKAGVGTMHRDTRYATAS